MHQQHPQWQQPPPPHARAYGYNQHRAMPGHGAMPPGYQHPPTPQYLGYGQQYAAAQHHAQHPVYAAQQWSACSAAAVSGAGTSAAFVPPAEMQLKEQRAAAEFDRPEAQAAEAAAEAAAEVAEAAAAAAQQQQQEEAAAEEEAEEEEEGGWSK